MRERLAALQKPKSIWVFHGGISTEREVSLRTGLGIADALKSRGYAVELFDVRPETLDALPWERKAEIVFLGLHGTWAEDGVIQGYLESRGVKYTGSDVLSSALCFHKGFTKNILRAYGLPTPHSFEICGVMDFEKLRKDQKWTDKNFNQKWFIKPAREGSTVGIERFDPSQAGSPEKHFMEKMALALSYDQDLVIEEWIEGPELTVPVLAGQALEVVEIRPKSQFYDYSSKYTAGLTEYICPAAVDAKITAESKAMAERAFLILKCADYARLDIMLGARGPLILEMNTLPGMTETSLVPKSARASGLSYEDFCEFVLCHSYTRQMKKVKR